MREEVLALTFITMNSLPLSRTCATAIKTAAISAIFTLTFLCAFLAISPKFKTFVINRAGARRIWRSTPQRDDMSRGTNTVVPWTIEVEV